MQQSHDCNLGQPMYNRCTSNEVLSTTLCLAEQTLNAKPLKAVNGDPEDLTTPTPNHFLLVREKAPAPFLLFSERYHDPRKDGLANTFRNGIID